MNKIELLLPGGDFEKMAYAYAFGADAVYLGIPRFSLRARENKFKNDSVVEAVEYAHRQGKLIYLTANIIPHNFKVPTMLENIDRLLEKCQPDAWIMSDPGMISMVKEKHPEQVIHLSVQANAVNYAAAKFWQNAGVSRIILSRELMLEEIKQIRDYCPDLELEAFIHGSICISYSGRCLISNYMSSRDPNQGTCSHSCRWQYKIHKKEEIQPAEWLNNAPADEIVKTQHGENYVPLKDDYYLEETERPGQFMQIDEDENGTYLMNARDLCAIEYLDLLRDAGVNSFKIEGRSKSVYYAAMIARTYRRAIDDLYAGKAFNPAYFQDIFSTANRGFTAGFLTGNPGKSAQRLDNSKPENTTFKFSGIVRDYDDDKKMVKIQPRNEIKEGMALELVTPQSSQTFTVKNLLNQKGQLTQKVSGGVSHCWVAMDKDPGEFALIREKLYQLETNEVQMSRNSME